jgi:hypothetical protein
MKINFTQFKEELYDVCGTDGRIILKWFLKQPEGGVLTVLK